MILYNYMKAVSKYILFALCIVFCACNNDDVDFTYSPATPHAGQRIVFNNLTGEGEDWAWNFGDGTESTSKYPTKVYSDPGTYVVTLNVDKKKWLTVSKTITVLDTVPTIAMSTDSVCYYQAVEFSADFFNPYSLAVSYRWTLPEYAVLQEGELTDGKLTVYFTEYNVDATVMLYLTVGDKTDTLQTAFRVHDTPATGLLFATAGKQLYRQRLYDYGVDRANRLPVDAQYLTGVAALLPKEDELFILNADPTEKGAVYKMDLATQQLTTVIRNSVADNAFGYYGGTIAGGYLYWTNAAHNIYRIPLTADNLQWDADEKYLYAAALALTGFLPGESADVAQYAQTFFCPATKGIYLFTEQDIASGVAPQTAAILQDYAVSAIGIDAIARKIYFVADGQLWVSNINGAYPKALTATTGMMAIDNTGNRIYFSDAEGISYLPLMQSPNNNTAMKATRFNSITDIVALAVDNKKR